MTVDLPPRTPPGWHGRPVLVTGARGFIGAHLCQRLSSLGARVHKISRAVVSAPGSDADWIRADLARQSDAEQVLHRTRPDIVFHLAGHVTGSQDLAQISPTLLQNLQSTVHLMSAAVDMGRPRIVLAGSMQEPHADDPSAVPCSPYAASKWACSGYARMFHALYGLPVAVARLFMVYGPGQWDLAKVLPYTIVSLLRGELPNIGSGTRELDWVYIDDAVDGLLAVADWPHADASAIDIGTGQLTSVRTVTEMVARALGSTRMPRFGAVADRPLERPHAARADDTARLLGWRATTSFGSGLPQTIEWYRRQLEKGAVGASHP